jgi:hypothetical protein
MVKKYKCFLKTEKMGLPLIRVQLVRNGKFLS